MVNQLGYPLGLITVEKELRQIPHLTLSPQKIPNRRADIICFANGIHTAHSLYPLLMIECKATPLTKKVINQVMGYNYVVQSPFITIANENEVQTGWYDYSTGEYTFISYLPSYNDLIQNRKGNV